MITTIKRLFGLTPKPAPPATRESAPVSRTYRPQKHTTTGTKRWLEALPPETVESANSGSGSSRIATNNRTATPATATPAALTPSGPTGAPTPGPLTVDHGPVLPPPPSSAMQPWERSKLTSADARMLVDSARTIPPEQMPIDPNLARIETPPGFSISDRKIPPDFIIAKGSARHPADDESMSANGER